MRLAVFVPENYRPVLDAYDTQRAIAYIKQTFQQAFSESLGLKRVSAPLFLPRDSGLNDDLSGVERPVSFDIPAVGTDAQVVHSLAKWKRLALKRYDFTIGGGLYADMNAIRRDEIPDNTHSIYVDQWDWEKIIPREKRELSYLRQVVCRIVDAICDTNERLQVRFPQLGVTLSREVTFVTARALEEAYPQLSPRQREDAFLQKHPTACITGIGGRHPSGKLHDSRAPDYDDWDLNCDIFFWDPVLKRALEISSMGIRVDAQSLERQLAEAGCEERRKYPFHQMLLRNELPLTIGGGIGQSRLCMLMLGCAHIGEVQCGIWDEETVKICRQAGIPLL